jgi:hypothetical protein
MLFPIAIDSLQEISQGAFASAQICKFGDHTEARSPLFRDQRRFEIQLETEAQGLAVVLEFWLSRKGLIDTFELEFENETYANLYFAEDNIAYTEESEGQFRVRFQIVQGL